MNKLLTVATLVFFTTNISLSQSVSNKNFSIGTYGRVGAGFAPKINGSLGRSLNLNGMGSIGGRMEEADYVEIATAFHFQTKETQDSTAIGVQARVAFYSSNGQFIGNVNSKSYGGITAALPELYAEAKHIMGSKWSAWIGAKYFRGGDIHIADHFYFDDHTTQGFGVSHGNTNFAVLFPGAVDTTSSVPPYYYLNIVDGTPRLGLRGRTILVLEHTLPLNNTKQTLKFLAEFHKLSNATVNDTTTAYNYPSDIGWVIGAKHVIPINTTKTGSFNEFSIRYGRGIANGNDGGNSKTWLTYGGPNLQTKKFTSAYSFSLTEHMMLNLSNKVSLNAYSLFTTAKGAADSNNTATDYFGRKLFNKKTEFAIGARFFYYFTNQFHLMTELHHTERKDGTQGTATLTKLSIIPTFVPTGERDPWARPQFRLFYTIGYYNDFAANNKYSPYLQEVGKVKWAHYFGVRVEWWIW